MQGQGKIGVKTTSLLGMYRKEAFVDGFKNKFHFATFLRCTIHMKDNINRELTARGLSTQNKREILNKIFGKQEGKAKFYCLIDCSTQDEFDEMVMGLKHQKMEF